MIFLTHYILVTRLYSNMCYKMKTQFNGLMVYNLSMDIFCERKDYENLTTDDSVCVCQLFAEHNVDKCG